MHPTDRREFLRAVGLMAAPALGLAEAAQAAQEEKNMVPELARLLTETIRARHGNKLEEAQYKSIQQRIAGNLFSAEALKRQTLRNSDEPDFVFFAE